MANLGSYLGSIRSNAYDPGSNFWANRGRGVSAPTSASTAREHEGVDYGTRGATGIGVSAAMGGILKIVDASTGFGMRVEVTTTMPDGTKIVVNYGHVKASSGLIDSQVVFAGQIIGTVEGKDVLTASGGTVGSGFTGPHLHLEIRKNGALQDPYQFDQWQGAQHFVGTDSVGNLKIAQTLTSAFDGSSFTTITTKSPAGVVLGSSQTSTLDLQDGGGNSIGTRTVYNTYGSYGSSQVVTVSGLNGNLVQRTTTQTNGDVFQERAGLRFQTINGVTSASVDGLAVPMTTQPDGSYNLATSSGNLNVKLNADPFAGGVITAAGQTFQFSGNDTLFVGNGGLWVQGAPTNDVNFPGEFNMRLIDATGSGTQFNYETKPPSLREGGFGIDSESQMSWQLTETILIGANASGAITDSFTLDTNASTLAGQNSNVIDLSAGSGEGNNLFAGIQLTGALASLDAAIKAEISKIASEGQNTWAAEAHDAWLINTAYTPSSGIAVLANSVAMPLSQNVFNETWGSTNDAVINTVIAQTLLEDASQQLALTQTWQLAAVDLANLGKH
jgi:Peptidase family M23